jgi:RNA polymerase sigma-70 factor, ECF subfamily
LFADLFNRFYPALFQIALDLVNNTAEAEDIVAETFAKYWKNPVKFSFMGELTNWLKLTTRNAAFDQLRRRATRQEYAQNLLQNQSLQEVGTSELYADILQEIYYHIEQLPDRSREVFTLRYLEGLTNEEIAVQLNIRNQSVRDHLARALKTLRTALAGNKTLFYFFLACINTK